MQRSLILHGAIALLPVLCFLAALVALDSYKLVRLRNVAAVIALGGVAAGASYLVNGWGMSQLDLGFNAYSRSIGPLMEELLKGCIVLALVRSHRIGFLVDAAIFGFAVGTGFAMVENLYYLQGLQSANIGVWIIRGFGTALLHGGVQSMFAVMVLALTDRRGRMDAGAVLPPLLVAWIVHGGFNNFVLPPLYQTLLLLVSLPPLMLLVFSRSERAVQGWLGTGFDADQDLLELLHSGNFTQSPHGQYLHSLRAHFSGAVVADLVCYLRLHVELALRAKGLLLMREAGIEPGIDEATRDNFEELRYLEGAVGPTALRAVKPLLQMSRRDLWQLYMLGK